MWWEKPLDVLFDQDKQLQQQETLILLLVSGSKALEWLFSDTGPENTLDTPAHSC